ncbi:response regulator transcription factor [Clostridium perfringens]|uniref:response regulator transcription factor n=1 Tax=Clostridium perfringens TaxID=1502 RepID=UPI002245FC92|nr:response regulator transcription factor [Clostridium perfringens]MCX0368941.1 response regulator transcription factor [Clostridium perfringens]
MRKVIYIADDENNIRNLVKTFLESNDYIVEDFENGDLLLERFKEKEADLVIIDIMMHGLDGFEICTKLREISIVPIIMLTARDSDLDYIKGLTVGSDDYLTKPFSPMALVMRVKAIFRRIEFQNNQKEKNLSLNYGDIEINCKNKSAICNDEILNLTPNEYNLLTYLFENKDKVISREELLNKVWGYESDVETRAVDDTIKRLRKKLLFTKVKIETVWGFGFRLKKK